MKNRLFIILTLLPLACLAQVEQIEKPISYNDYMEQVREKNLAYAAEKLNIPISDANIRSARLFNDPSLSVEYANNDDHRMQMGQGVTVELSKTFSIGKLSARVDLARSEKELTIALLEDFFRSLRANATTAYFEAIKQRQLYSLRLNSYNSIRELAKADSIKFSFGKITETDARQSNLEADMSYNELLQAHGDLHNAYAGLNIHLGLFAADTIYIPTGELEIESHNFVYGELIAQALENRSDLAAAMKNVDVAQRALKLARRERNTDFDLALGYNHNTQVRNELAPAPKFNGMTVGVSIPLKFSNFNRAAVQSASLAATQAETLYRQAQLEVQTDVLQNYNSYLSLNQQVERFNKGMLEQAKAVIEGKTYSYNRGETSLLEVLSAQHTYNQVRAMYIETLFSHYISQVTLCRSAGIWTITVKQP